MSPDPDPPIDEQSFVASTTDQSVWVRVAVKGGILGVQLEPAVMQRPGHEIAERIMACADVAYLEGQVALRGHAERAHVDPESLTAMATADDLTRARARLQEL
jgi:Protein of unknown function (DUF2694)